MRIIPDICTPIAPVAVCPPSCGTVEAGPRPVKVNGHPDRAFTVDQARHLAAALYLAAELASGGVL